MTTRPSTLTRPQRKGLYTALMWVAWLTVLMWMLASHSVRTTHLVPVPSNTWNRYHSTQELGVPTYLVIETSRAVSRTSPRITNTESTWEWKPWNIALLMVIALAWALCCRFGYVWFMGRARVPDSVCDECGYNLTGLTGGRCPECGTARA